MRFLYRIFLIVLVLFSIGRVSLLPQEDSKTLLKRLEAQLKAELEGKSFITKINLPHHYIGSNAVSTQVIPPFGNIYYVEEPILSLKARSFENVEEVDPDYLPVGSSVRVKKVKMYKNLVELLLVDEKGAESDVDLGLGKGYETRYTFESIMMLISRVLNIDYKRFERILLLKNQYSQIKNQLQFAVKALQRLQIAQKLHEVLTELIELIEPYNKGAPEYLQYQQEKANLDTLIQTLQPQAQQERLAEIQEILKKEFEEENRVKQYLRTKPANLSETEEQLNLIRRWEEILKHRQQLFQEMTSLGVSLSAEEANLLEENFHELNLAQKELTECKSKLMLQQLENEYQLMKQQRLKLYDAYTRAFGSPQEKDAKANLLDHLQRMYENRCKAEQLGSKKAGAEAVKLLEEIKRMQSK